MPAIVNPSKALAAVEESGSFQAISQIPGALAVRVDPGHRRCGAESINEKAVREAVLEAGYAHGEPGPA